MTQTSYFQEHPMSATELRTLDPRRTMSIDVLRSTGVLDNLHAEAWIEAIERNWASGQFPHWTDETFQWFIRRLRVEWSVSA